MIVQIRTHGRSRKCDQVLNVWYYSLRIFILVILFMAILTKVAICNKKISQSNPAFLQSIGFSNRQCSNSWHTTSWSQFCTILLAFGPQAGTCCSSSLTIASLASRKGPMRRWSLSCDWQSSAFGVASVTTDIAASLSSWLFCPPHWLQGRWESVSEFVCLHPHLCWISKSNSDFSSHHVTVAL